MKSRFSVFLILSWWALTGFSQSDESQIVATLEKFIDGTTFNYPDKIREAFYPGAKMFLANTADTVLIMTSDEYAALYDNRTPGQKNGRISAIKTIDIFKDVAYARLEIEIPSWKSRFNDLLLLKQIEGNWLVVSKVTTMSPIGYSENELQVRPTKKIVLDKLRHPWSMAFLSEMDVIIAEKEGDLLRVNLETQERIPIDGMPLDVCRAQLIDTARYPIGTFPLSAHGQTLSFNAGWFQVLLDPDFEENQYLYLSYSAVNDHGASTTKVIRGRLLNNKLIDHQTILIADPYSHGLFHFGGGMIFGPDGKLYIAIGERNFFEYLNPPLPLAQNPMDKRGKIFRLNPDGSIPEDNPDFGPNATPGLYALGIRATQGLTLDPNNGTIWFTDHGTIQGDEINLLRAGANYGWPFRTTGSYRTPEYNPEVPERITFTEPVHYWDQTVAPTGLCYYNGTAFPQWKGDLIIPGLSRGSLWRARLDGDKISAMEELLITDRVRIRKVIVSPRGKLYLLTDENNGKLIELTNEPER